MSTFTINLILAAIGAALLMMMIPNRTCLGVILFTGIFWCLLFALLI